MTGPADILRRLGEAGPADRDLLARFAGQRDQAAFAELVRRHGPLVLGVCRRVTGHAEDAEDAFQAVFLVLAKKAGRIAKPELLGNWLYGVAVRVASKARRSASRRRAREVAVSPLPDPPSPSESAPVFADLGPILDEELAGLPEWYREAILLCDLRGISREEAATLLGVPEGTLSSRLANGRKKLAARLARRGVLLSLAGLAGMFGQAQAAGAAPSELVAKTCGLVESWSAGGAVPDPLARLILSAEGGFAVRKSLLIGVLVVAAAAGAVVAAGSGNQNPPSQSPRVAAAAKLDLTVQERGEEKEGAKGGYTTQPRMLVASDLNVGNLQSFFWSPDGSMIAVQGSLVAGQTHNDVVDVTAIRPPGGERPISVQFALQGPAKLIGFTPMGNGIITDQREYQLVSGFHRLRFMKTEFSRERAVVLHNEPRIVELDSEETHGYAFAADGKTFRTIAYERDGSGQPRRIDVREVDASSGKTLKSLLKIDYAEHLLSPNGTRLATAADGKLVIHDVDRGAKLSAYALPEAPALPPLTSSPYAQFGGNFAGMLGGGSSRPEREHRYLCFSPDASKLVVSRAIGQTVVIDTETGKPLPALEGTEMMRTHPTNHAFTGDGRLLAMTGTHYTIQKTTPRGGGRQFVKEQEMLSPGRNFLTVWDTQTGKVMKSWDRSPGVAFSPARPVLAILEPNGENTTRLGLWDFSSEVEKK